MSNGIDINKYADIMNKATQNAMNPYDQNNVFNQKYQSKDPNANPYSSAFNPNQSAGDAFTAGMTAAIGPADQKTGSNTSLENMSEDEVKAFQTEHGLTVDGMVGPETTNAFNAINNPQKDGFGFGTFKPFQNLKEGKGLFGKEGGFMSGQGALSQIGQGDGGFMGDFGTGQGALSQIGQNSKFGTGEGALSQWSPIKNVTGQGEQVWQGAKPFTDPNIAGQYDQPEDKEKLSKMFAIDRYGNVQGDPHAHAQYKKVFGEDDMPTYEGPTKRGIFGKAGGFGSGEGALSQIGQNSKFGSGEGAMANWKPGQNVQEGRGIFGKEGGFGSGEGKLSQWFGRNRDEENLNNTINNTIQQGPVVASENNKKVINNLEKEITENFSGSENVDLEDSDFDEFGYNTASSTIGGFSPPESTNVNIPNLRQPLKPAHDLNILDSDDYNNPINQINENGQFIETNPGDPNYHDIQRGNKEFNRIHNLDGGDSGGGEELPAFDELDEDYMNWIQNESGYDEDTINQFNSMWEAKQEGWDSSKWDKYGKFFQGSNTKDPFGYNQKKYYISQGPGG